jgi:CBS domain containing-hemolysin-like protein
MGEDAVSWAWWAWSTLLVGLLAALASVMSAMIERSGPVRLRSWVEEAGGRLEALLAHPARFEAYRYLLSFAAKGLPLLLVLLLETVLTRAGVGAGLSWSLGAVLLLLALTEALNRLLVRRLPEEVLERLSPLYRSLLTLLTPLLALLAPLMTLPVEEREPEEEDEEASEGEIEAFLDFGAREGILEPGEEELVRGIVVFGDTQVKSVMTPRIDIICAPVGASLGELRELFLDSGHSRLPMYEESIDRVVGILHIRDLLRALGASESLAAAALAKPPFFIPETKTLDELLKEMQAGHQQMAIVVDEYGGTSGLVTVEDLLEEIVGEIIDEHEVERPEVEALADGSWRLDGRVHVEALEELFGVDMGETDSETVGGLVFSTLGYVPKVGDTIELGELKLWVESLDDRRIQTVRAEPRAGGPGKEGAAGEPAHRGETSDG